MNDAASAPAARDGRPMAPFLVIWSGQACSLIGSSLVQFAIIWWLTETSGSATVLALGTMMEYLPRVVVSPFAGALIDRWSRRAVMIASDALIAGALVVLGILYALGAVQVWHVYLLMLLRATCIAFQWPAMQASTTLMVPDRHLGRVAGMNQALRGLAAIATPPLGAVLYELLPMQWVLAVDVVTALLAIGPLAFISVPQPARAAESAAAAGRSVLADLWEAVRLLWAHPGLVIVIAIATVSNMLANPAYALVPLLVRQRLGGGALALGWVQSAAGIGVLVGGIVLGIWGGFRRRIVTISLASILGSVGFVVIGLAPPNAIPLAVGIAFSIGFFNPIVNGSYIAFFQATAPPEMQGRILALIVSVTAATTPIGLAIAGPVADAAGVHVWFLLSGAVTAVASGFQLLLPPVARLHELEEEAAAKRAAAPGIGPAAQ